MKRVIVITIENFFRIGYMVFISKLFESRKMKEKKELLQN